MKLSFGKTMKCYYCKATRQFEKTSTGVWICKSCGQPR